MGEAGEFFGVGGFGVHDVEYGVAADEEGVADEAAVAAPGDGFGAHDGERPGLVGEVDEALDAGGELGGLHVVGVPAERGVAPPGVGRVLGGVAESAEVGESFVPDAGVREAARQYVFAELGVVARFGHGAHINEGADAVGAQYLNEFVDRMRRVPDRVELGHAS